MQRIQLSLEEARNNLPTGAIFIPRSRYRNYCIGQPLARYQEWLEKQLEEEPSYLLGLTTFKYLACTCSLSERCHVDILINKLKEKYNWL